MTTTQLETPIPGINKGVMQTNVWLWLTLPIAILLGIAAAGGLFMRDLYHNNPFYVAQAVGQDFISLVVVVPTLLGAAFLASRGSPRARLVWLGTLAYLVYCYATASFEYSFNSLFLVYVALLGCSLYALLGGLTTMNMAGIKARFTGRTPIKATSIYLAVITVLFYFTWLSEIVPALIAGTIPQHIQDSGTPSSAVYVLDLAWILPAFGIAAIYLWRKKALGYILAGTLLSFLLFMILAILGMVIVAVWEGEGNIGPLEVMFGGLFAITLGMLIWYMKGLRLPPG